MTAIEEEIRKTPVDGYPRIEERLLATLQDSKATFACKQWVCRRLRQVGSEKSVDALAALLTDEKLSSFARLAMEGMKCDKVNGAIRDALGKTKGKLRIGMISSLGARRDAGSVGPIAALLTDKDPETASAAIFALGRIGTPDAAKALSGADVDAKMIVRRDQALVDCGYAMLAAGKKDDAGSLAEQLFAETKPEIVRIGALGLLFRADPGKAVSASLELLQKKDSKLAAAAGQLLARAEGEGITKALAEKLPKMSPASQAVLISTLAVRGDKAAAPAVLKVLGASSDKTVRTASVKALGAIGGAGEVPVLCKLLSDAELGRDAEDSLKRIKGEGVGQALGKIATGDGEEKVRAKIIEIITSRGESNAMDSVLKATGDGSESVRRAAFKALGVIGKPADLSKMVALLVKSKTSAEMTELGRSIFIIANKLEGDDRTKDVTAGLKGAPPQAQASLLEVLGRLGGPAALAVVRQSADSSEADVAKAAIKAMSTWPDASPLDDLVKLAESEKDKVRKILALQGMINMIAMPADRSIEDSVNLLEKAMSIADRPDEKKAVLSRLPDFANDKAKAMAQKAAQDPALKREAGHAIKKIDEAMKLPAALASAKSSEAKRAVDGNSKSYWNTGRGMKKGDWIRVEFRGETKKLKGFTMTIGRSRDDYPREYEVFVSDGKSWSKEPVAKGKGRRGKDTSVKFKKPLEVAGIKVVQTGSAGNRWVIYEFKFEIAK
jgi:HEAT repeat protein